MDSNELPKVKQIPTHIIVRDICDIIRHLPMTEKEMQDILHAISERMRQDCEPDRG